jgi:hypothetical protein
MLEVFAAEIGVASSEIATIWLSEKIDRSLTAAASTGLGPDRASSGVETATRGVARARVSRTSNVRPRLHEEIAAVLRANGEPMSVAEIANEIRERGVYRPPRSRQPIGTAAVSSRISNPHYRSLFSRSGRAVSLAK